jgi:hypothetical protein
LLCYSTHRFPLPVHSARSVKCVQILLSVCFSCSIVRKLCTVRIMSKPSNRHVRVMAATHQILSRLSNELGVSMSAILQIAIVHFAGLSPRGRERGGRYAMRNARTASVSVLGRRRGISGED